MTRHKISHQSRHRLALMCLSVTVAAMVMAKSAPLYAEMLKAPDSRIAIDLPPSYEISKIYNGFIMPQTRISIIVFEFPTSGLAAMKARLTPEALAAKGLTNVVHGRLKRTDDHLYLTAQQAAATSSPSKLVPALGRVKKHILLINNGTYAALITANVPVAVVEQSLISPQHIAKVLATARIDATAAPSNDPFTLSYLGRFKEAGKLQASAKLFTEDGRLIPAKRGEVRNAVIVAPSINQLPVSDVAAYAKRAWKGFQSYEGLEIVDETETSAGGLEGYLIKGTAKRKTPAGEVAMYLAQVFLKRKGGGYFRIVLIGKASERSSLEPEFAKIVAGFKPRD